MWWRALTLAYCIPSFFVVGTLPLDRTWWLDPDRASSAVLRCNDRDQCTVTLPLVDEGVYRLVVQEEPCSANVHANPGSAIDVTWDHLTVGRRYLLCGCRRGLDGASACTTPSEFVTDFGELRITSERTAAAFSPGALPTTAFNACRAGSDCANALPALTAAQQLSGSKVIAGTLEDPCGRTTAKTENMHVYGLQTYIDVPPSSLPSGLDFLVQPGLWRLCGCPGAAAANVRTRPTCETTEDFHADIGILAVLDEEEEDITQIPLDPPRHAEDEDDFFLVDSHLTVPPASVVLSHSFFRTLPPSLEGAASVASSSSGGPSAATEEENRVQLGPEPRRGLQTDGDPLAAEIANRKNATEDALDGSHQRAPRNRTKCERDTDCLDRFGSCENGLCRGFIPDFNDKRVIQCVDSYRCTVHPGDLPGVAVASDFQVIGISPHEKCGAANPLKPAESVFANSNRWECEDGHPDSCVFTAGVGMRLNSTADVEAIRLCGCPNIEGDGSGKRCDHRREFFVPLGLLTVQECLRNAHCIDHQFAYCVNGHCAGASGVAAGAGLRVFQCVTSRDCDIKALTEKKMHEALKVLPITANFSCGADVALDPDLIDDNALPCVVDINNDGHCDINLGLPRTLGTTRLCGCTGDKGGNGRDCDQLEDFDSELGTVEVGECIVDADCPNIGEVCVESKCFTDNFPPYVVSAYPGNNSYAVPPINEVILTWNENVKFTKANRKLVIACINCEEPKKWEMEVRDTSTYKVAQAGYSITLKGREMRIIPDVTMASFPEGKYVLGYEGGIVADVFENFNKGAIDITFTISKTAGCPFLYVTGFSTSEINLNGLYTAVEPVSRHAAWRGGSGDAVFLYWKTEEPARNQPGNWIFSAKTDERNFVGYADLQMMASLGRSGEARPPNGKWKKWQTRRWVTHPDIVMACRTSVDRSFPKLIEIHPRIASTSVPTDNTTVVMRFSEPITYGHWGNITFVGRDIVHRVAFAPDFEAGMRGVNIKSDMRGTVELSFDGLDHLHSGEVYDVVADLGCLTDLAYNPWGPVEPGVLYFTTYGMSCTPFPPLGPAYIVKGNATAHGSHVELSCADGYTSHMGSPSKSKADGTAAPGTATAEDDDDDEDDMDHTRSATTTASASSSHTAVTGPVPIQCIDGTWEDVQLQCNANCPRYTDLGPQYIVEGDQGTNPHGTTLKVSCANNTVIVQGTGTADLTCNDGQWGKLDLRCGATCGPFPSLGPSYNVGYDGEDPGSASSVIGSRRVVRCSSTAQRTHGHEPAYVVCEEQGWSVLDLECHTPCHDLPKYSDRYRVRGTGNLHGDFRNITCARGYRGETSGEQPLSGTSAFCNEGRWEQEAEFLCLKDCGEFNRGPGYRATPASGQVGAHNSTVRIECSADAIHESGPHEETLRCRNGNWDLGEVVCNGPCRAPEEVLGRSYMSHFPAGTKTNSNGLFPHGSGGFLYCAPDASILGGSPPEHVVCNNGAWVPGDTLDMSGVSPTSSAFSEHPRLVCSSSCGPFSKDLKRYVASGGGAKAIAGGQPGGTGTLQCYEGLSSVDPQQTRGTFACENGRWVDKYDFTCVLTCGPSVLRELFQRNYDLTDPAVTSLDHAKTTRVKCPSGTSIRFGDPGLSTAEVRCNAGHLEWPDMVCAAPTCRDQIKNGKEEAVDCGGPDCRPCTSCELAEAGRRTCPSPPTCTDHVKNGREVDVDCGGPDCPPCEYCVGFPAALTLGMKYTFDAGRTYQPVTPALRSEKTTRTLVGTRLDVACDAPDYEQETEAPLLRFQTYRCDAEAQTWELDDGSLSLVLKCREPRCDDGIMNGDEWGIDCGGSCPNACPSCIDGIQNNEEEAVDCGGPHCLPCSACSISPFKALNPKAIRVDVLDPTTNTTKQELAETWNVTGSNHGDRRRITCRENPESHITLQCTNGQWERLDGAGSLYHLQCEGSLVEQSNAYAFANNQIQTFRVPTFPLPMRCVDGSGGTGQKKFADVDGCCSVMTRFNQVLAGGECGALLFGAKSAQVKGFCKGACYAQLQTLMDQHRHLHASEACPSYDILVELFATFCEQGQRPPVLPGSSSGAMYDDASGGDSGSFYCFAAAGDTLSLLKHLDSLRGAQLDYACAPKSCFVSNLRYFELSRDLYVFSQDPSFDLGRGARRNLRESGGDDTDFDTVADAFATSMQKYLQLRDTVLRSLVLPDILSGPPSSLRRSLLPSTGTADFLLGSLESSAVRDWVVTSRFSRRVLNLMCLKDSNDASCARVVSELIAGSSTSPQHAAASASAVSPPLNPPASSIGGDSGIDATCANKCKMLVTRHLGQTLLEEGQTVLDPHTAMLGLLLRSYGRIACQKSAAGMSCSEVFGMATTSAMAAAAGTNRIDDVGDAAAQRNRADTYKDCQCPVTYIGDGRCDRECYNPACGFDEDDCLFETMFPLTYQRLTSITPLSSPCHPLRSQFNCQGSSSAIDVGRQGQDCRAALTEVLNNDGCCAAARWDVLRESLSLDIDMRHRSADRFISASNSGSVSATELHPGLTLARSSSWLETTCNAALDRTCSRGLRRSAIKIGFTMRQLDYDGLFSGTMGELVKTVMSQAMRDAFSNVLAIPMFDITEVRFWPGSVVVEVIVDPGLAVAEVMKDLKVARESGALAKHVEKYMTAALRRLEQRGFIAQSGGRRRHLGDATASNFIDDISLSWATVQQPQLSTARSPGIPVAGTLDMDDLTSALRNPSCPESLDFSPPPPASAEENAPVYTMDPVYGRSNTHGSTRQVRCAEGYAPTAKGSGPSPQYLKCDRGRWISAVVGEPRLVCRKPCGPYETWDRDMDRATINVVSDGSDNDGATRVLSCVAGYSPVPGAKSPETLFCQSGAWDRRSLECVRTDLTNQALQSAECGKLKLASVIEPPVDVFLLKQVFQDTVDLGEILPTAEGPFATHKRPTSMTLWSLRCTRGYVPADASEEVTPIFCVNGTLLASKEFHVPDWDSGTTAQAARDKLQLEVIRQYFAYTLGTDPPSSLSNEPHAATGEEAVDVSTVTEPTEENRLNYMSCAPDVRTPPWLSPSQPGLSNAWFYTLVFCGSCLALILGMLVLYCKKTACMSRPFFDTHGGGGAVGDKHDDDDGQTGDHPENTTDRDVANNERGRKRMTHPSQSSTESREATTQAAPVHTGGQDDISGSATQSYQDDASFTATAMDFPTHCDNGGTRCRTDLPRNRDGWEGPHGAVAPPSAACFRDGGRPMRHGVADLPRSPTVRKSDGGRRPSPSASSTSSHGGGGAHHRRLPQQQGAHSNGVVGQRQKRGIRGPSSPDETFQTWGVDSDNGDHSTYVQHDRAYASRQYERQADMVHATAAASSMVTQSPSPWVSKAPRDTSSSPVSAAAPSYREASRVAEQDSHRLSNYPQPGSYDVYHRHHGSCRPPPRLGPPRRVSLETSSGYSESAASSFYSELEVDLERLHEFCVNNPGFDHQLVQGLKHWRSVQPGGCAAMGRTRGYITPAGQSASSTFRRLVVQGTSSSPQERRAVPPPRP